MILYKACPECGGDCQWDDDENEWHCFQGGHHFSQEKMREIVEEVQKKKQAQNPPPPQASGSHRRRGGQKKPLTEYYERNKQQIIADAKTYGELATREKWGIKGPMWTNLKKRWGLPVNPRGNIQGTPSVLPPKVPLPEPQTSAGDNTLIVDALIQLGFSQKDANEAVATLPDKPLPLEQAVVVALRHLDKGANNQTKPRRAVKLAGAAPPASAADIKRVELIPIPPRPHPLTKTATTKYYEDNKEQIIAEARFYGECDTRKRWGIESGTWTRLKYRWNLPVNKRGQRMAKSGLPRAAEAGPSPSSKRPKHPRKRRDITAKPVGAGVIALGKILCDLSGVSNRDALLILHQAERHIHQQRNGGGGSTLGPDAWTLPLSTIINICADSFGFTADDLKSHRRDKRLAMARQVSMYVSHETGNFSMVEIGQALDSQDHATVSHGVFTIKRKLREGNPPFLKQTIKEIIAQL